MHGQPPKEREPGIVIFHPSRLEEYNAPHASMHVPQQLGSRPKYKDFCCGECGNQSHGRVVCDLLRKSDGALVQWCLCPCEGATIIIEKDGAMIAQHPLTAEYKIGRSWPPDLAQLYSEGAKSYSAGAYTATAMVCRKLLMSCACQHGAQENGTFTAYVDHIVSTLGYQPASESIKRIKKIGGDANHKLEFVNADQAKQAMDITTYLLNTLYSLPAA